jgi:hypothetical protein
MPPLSPKTQFAMEGAPAPQDAEAIFEERLSEMAHNHLVTKYPALAERVQMFTVLDVDLERDLGVGTFVLEVGGHEVHLPVVSDRGRLAPLDILYVKSFDTFIPLSDEWLQYLATDTPEAIGTAEKAPQMLQTDVDIRNLVVPPMTGRYSYASAKGDLMDVLALTPNHVKHAFIKRLQGSHKLANYVLNRYGRDRLAYATAPGHDKTASAAVRVPAVELFDTTTALETIKQAFAGATSSAYYAIRNRGYVAIDRRPDPKLAYFKEYLGRYTTSDRAGFYTLFLRDGEERMAFVAPDPVLLTKNQPYGKRAKPKAKALPEHGSRKKLSDKNCVFAYTDKGELLFSDRMAPPVVGIADDETLTEEALRKVFPSSKLGEPREGRGFFMGLHGNKVVVTEPVDIEKVTLRSNGTYIITAIATSCGEPVVIRKGPDFRSETIQVGDYGDYPEVRIPEAYRFVKTTSDLNPNMVCVTPESVRQSEEMRWKQAGAAEISVIEKAGSYGIDHALFPDRTVAARYLILDRDLSAVSAENLLKMAELKGRSRALVLGRPALLKMAQGEMPMPPQGMPPEGMDPSMMDPSMMDPSMMDPSMMDPSMMDPSMMDPSMMAPPPPSPVEIAAQEVASVLQAQTSEVMQQMEQQAMLLDAQVQAINSVLGRAQEISMGAPPMGPQDIMAASQSPVMASPVGAGPGPMPGAPMGPPPGAPPMGTPELEAAADVESEFPASDAFDTSAVASLISEDGIDDLASAQLPKFRKALDGIARTLLEMRIKGPELKDEIGEQRFEDQTGKLKKVLNALGSVLLSLYRSSKILVSPDQQEMEADL